MNAVARPTKSIVPAIATADHDTAIRTALKSSLYPGATDASVDMVLAYCRAAMLDPMTKPVHIVPMRVKKPGTRDYEWRDVVMPGIELYRTKAARTSEYAGQDEAVFGDEIDEKFGELSVSYPDWCKVTVYRIVGGIRYGFTAKVFWIECYATAGSDTDAPNSMWRKRPYGQLEKCAEALALRKAFPEAVGGHATAEEMEGREIEGEFAVVPPKPAIALPRAKATPAANGEQAPAAPDVKPEPDGQAQAADEGAADGVIDLNDSQKKVLARYCEAAGLDLAAVAKQFPRVDNANINDVIGWLRDRAQD